MTKSNIKQILKKIRQEQKEDLVFIDGHIKSIKFDKLITNLDELNKEYSKPEYRIK